jgi:RimJ/RimL family protein N-acetyltransferase
MRALEKIETKRLLLERPRASDAADMFVCYSNDEEGIRFLTWPRHQSLADAEVLVAMMELASD